METIIFSSTKEIKKEQTLLERKLGVKIKINGRKVTFEGNTFDEYEASIILEAINFGFPAQIAMLLKDEEVVFRKLNIKNFTRRKNLEIVKGRLIGTHGRTKQTIESLADCKIIIKGNEIGIICSGEEIEYAITSVTSLIKGSKQGNVYKFLERINASRKEFDKK